MSILKIGSVTLAPDDVPQRTSISRSRSRRRLVPGAYNLDGIKQDFGLAEHFSHVFQSEGNTGRLTTAQVRALEAMEEGGAAVTVETDLFGDLGVSETFTGEFDPETKPTYVPLVWVVSQSTYVWAFEIPMLLKPGG